MAQDKASKPGTRFGFHHTQSYQGSRSVTPPCLSVFEYKTLNDEDSILPLLVLPPWAGGARVRTQPGRVVSVVTEELLEAVEMAQWIKRISLPSLVISSAPKAHMIGKNQLQQVDLSFPCPHAHRDTHM